MPNKEINYHYKKDNKKKKFKTKNRNIKANKTLKKKGGGVNKNSFSFLKYKGKDAYRWLFRKRANIFDIDTFIFDRKTYLRTLFIYLRYRNKIEKEKFRDAVNYRKNKSSNKILPDWFSQKNPLRLALDEIHLSVTTAVGASDLTLDNKVSYKNCLCIAIVDTIKSLPEIKKSKELGIIFSDIAKLVLSTSKLFKDDNDFKSRMSVKFIGFTKLNFSLLNMYDYGFSFNFFYYGPYFNEKLEMYDTDNVYKKEVRDQRTKSKFYLNELKKIYRKYKDKDKKNIFPNPEQNDSLIILEETKNEILKNLLATDSEKIIREFGNEKDSKDLYTKFDSHLRFYNSLIRNRIENEIYVLNGREVLELGFKNRVQNIYENYSKDTEGLARNNGNFNRNILENVDNFNKKFLEQMESCTLALNTLIFKTNEL